jgi:hypothetical protein
MASKLFHLSHGFFKCVSSQLISYSIGIILIETIIGTEASKVERETSHLG